MYNTKKKQKLTKETKNAKRRRVIALLILLSLIVPAVYLSIMLFVGKKYDSNKVLMLTQCILGIFAFFLPNIISKKWDLNIPPLIYFTYILFLYCSIVLGEVRSFYYKYPYWDDLLHFFSGMMCGSIGFSIVALLNKNVESMHLSPIFIMMFAICFSVTIGVVWEIYEFSFDGILGLNMQKFALDDGTQLIGRLALYDTMKDLIIDLCGAGLMSILGYISLINNKGWFKENLEIKAKQI